MSDGTRSLNEARGFLIDVIMAPDKTYGIVTEAVTEYEKALLSFLRTIPSDRPKNIGEVVGTLMDFLVTKDETQFYCADVVCALEPLFDKKKIYNAIDYFIRHGCVSRIRRGSFSVNLQKLRELQNGSTGDQPRNSPTNPESIKWVRYSQIG